MPSNLVQKVEAWDGTRAVYSGMIDLLPTVGLGQWPRWLLELLSKKFYVVHRRTQTHVCARISADAHKVWLHLYAVSGQRSRNYFIFCNEYHHLLSDIYWISPADIAFICNFNSPKVLTSIFISLRGIYYFLWCTHYTEVTKGFVIHTIIYYHSVTNKFNNIGTAL